MMRFFKRLLVSFLIIFFISVRSMDSSDSDITSNKKGKSGLKDTNNGKGKGAAKKEKMKEHCDDEEDEESTEEGNTTGAAAGSKKSNDRKSSKASNSSAKLLSIGSVLTTILLISGVLN